MCDVSLDVCVPLVILWFCNRFGTTASSLKTVQTKGSSFDGISFRRTSCIASQFPTIAIVIIIIWTQKSNAWLQFLLMYFWWFKVAHVQPQPTAKKVVKICPSEKLFSAFQNGNIENFNELELECWASRHAPHTHTHPECRTQPITIHAMTFGMNWTILFYDFKLSVIIIVPHREVETFH